jgi:hypothetical protein
VTLEVRCCCQPAKLLGFLELPEKPALGAEVKFALTWAPGVQRAQSDPPAIVALTWGSWSSCQYSTVDGTIVRAIARGEAFKSNDTPIETLRRISGFVEL